MYYLAFTPTHQDTNGFQLYVLIFAIVIIVAWIIRKIDWKK